MRSGRRGFLAVAGCALVGLAGCADSDPSPSNADDTGATATTGGAQASVGDSTTAAAGADDSASSPDGTASTGQPAGESTTGTTSESTTGTTSETTTEPSDSPAISVLSVISNEGEYERGDVEREAIDEVDRGDRVALAARYRVTVHDGAVDVRFGMRIDDPEGYSAEYPPYEQSAEGLDAASIEDEFYKAFATDEFRAGEYTATLAVTDQIADRSTTATTTFTVTD